MVNILFVCSANRFRSVIAAEHLRSLLIKDPLTAGWQVSSAGTWAKNGLPPIPQALRFAASRRLDIGDVRSRDVNREILTAATLVIVMTESQREALKIEFPDVSEKVFLLSKVCADQVFDIPDPFEKDDQTGDAIGDEIMGLVSNGYSRICDMAGQLNAKRSGSA
jgi:protein-tyrosine phosphatase